MTVFSFRIDDQLYETVKKTAANNHRSINSELLRAIEYYLKHAPEAQYDTVQPKQEKPLSDPLA